MDTFFSHTIGIEFTEWGVYHFIPISLIIVGVLLIYYFRNEIRDSKNEKYFRYTLGTIGIVAEVSLQIWKLSTGNYVLDDLPIGVCSFSLFMSIYVMFTKSFKVYEIAYFWAIGGVLSILFPDILYGPDRYRYYEYVIGHTSFFFMIMYMLFVHDFIPTFNSFKKSFVLLLAVVLVFIIPVNNIFGTNFMYLLEPGDTPFGIFWGNGYFLYLVGCIVLSMIVLYIWYLPIVLYRKYKKTT
ncbi:MAG: Integral membrane protein [Candidatus Izimaplasma bacterium HR2]|nr:MAG: Integral membrane protein [Candidatus Izimaplasma bacterium HR2]